MPGTPLQMLLNIKNYKKSVAQCNCQKYAIANKNFEFVKYWSATNTFCSSFFTTRQIYCILHSQSYDY